jgi:hypothetical protein
MAIRWARNPLLAALLLVAFGSRALVPAGFMPGPGGLMLCPGHTPVAASSDSHPMQHDMSGMDMAGMDMTAVPTAHHTGHGGDSGSDGSHEGMTLCPFAAAAGALASVPTAHASVIHVEVVSTTVDIPPQPAFVRSTIVPTRLPRGPPAAA